MNDLIKREDAIQAFGEYLMSVAMQEYAGTASEDIEDWKDLARLILSDVPSEIDRKTEPHRLSNKEWKEFLSEQFGISKTSAKEMLHGMMRWKKEDNFKRTFNPIKNEASGYKLSPVEDEPQTEDLQDWKDRMWAEAVVIEPQAERSE